MRRSSLYLHRPFARFFGRIGPRRGRGVSLISPATRVPQKRRRVRSATAVKTNAKSKAESSKLPRAFAQLHRRGVWCCSGTGVLVQSPDGELHNKSAHAVPLASARQRPETRKW